jgi:type 1 glutamine amidotransferase
MSISIRTVLLLGFFGAGTTLAACGGYVNLGDPSMAGAGGDAGGTGGTQATGAGATGGTGSGAGPATGGTSDGTGEAGSGGGTGGDGPAEGGAGSGGSAPIGAGGNAEAGAGGSAASDVPPLAPRSGSFKMLVYSGTMGFNHASIASGRQMLDAIAKEQNFEVTMTNTNEEITPEGLAKYEAVFFLNTSGDVFTDAQQDAFEAWITTRNGAFVGVHSAADTEVEWSFYKELTGQYYDLHGPAGTPGDVLLEAAAAEFPGMAGIPSPWSRTEEWYNFDSHEAWSEKPGFTILARRADNDHPVSWTREFGNVRSFYTALGHDPEAYEDELFKAHVAGGILWTVRREHLFQE